jgi:hypothetical protein
MSTNIHQLSLFLENRSGAINEICQTLKDAAISIRTLSLADTEQFGILRLLVKEWEAARDALSKAGFVVKVTDVTALTVEDRPGGLAAILDALAKHGVNVEYMYAFTFGSGDKAIMVFRFADHGKAMQALKAENIDTVKEMDLFK